MAIFGHVLRGKLRQPPPCPPPGQGEESNASFALDQQSPNEPSFATSNPCFANLHTEKVARAQTLAHRRQARRLPHYFLRNEATPTANRSCTGTKRAADS